MFGAAAVGGADTNPFTPAAGITELWDADTGGGSSDESSDAGIWGGQRPAPAIGSHTLTAAPATTDDWAMAAVEVNPDDPAISIDDVTDTEGDTGENDSTSRSRSTRPPPTPSPSTGRPPTGRRPRGDNDYDSNSGTVTFAPGDTSETVTVKVNGDNKDEPNETFNVNLSSNSANSSILDSQGVGTITDDDPAPSISIDDISVTEGNAGTTSANFTLSLEQPVLADRDGRVRHLGRHGDRQPLDYASHSETVSFAPGDTSETVTVQVNGDLIDEPDETFNGDLTTPRATARSATRRASRRSPTTTARRRVSVNDVSEAEGDSGTTDFDFTVSLSNPTRGSRHGRLRHLRRHRDRRRQRLRRAQPDGHVPAARTHRRPSP